MKIAVIIVRTLVGLLFIVGSVAFFLKLGGEPQLSGNMKTYFDGLTAYELKMFKRETTEMFLYEIGVDEDHQQKGVATALIEFLKEICASKGIVEMFVGTEKDNIAARKLYATTGGVADEDSVWFNYLF